MTLFSPWWRVLRGASQVAQHWTRQRALEGEKVAVRVGQHGIDLSDKAAASMGTQMAQMEAFFVSMQKQRQQQQEPSTDGVTDWEPPSHSTTPSTSANLHETSTTNAELLSATPADTIHELYEPSASASPSQELTSEEAMNAGTGISKSTIDETGIITSSDLTVNHNNAPQVEGVAVPATRLARAFGFARLGASLAWGTARQGVTRLVGPDQSHEDSSSLFVHSQNADQVAATLCRMRGAALKLGQMLSIQDASLLPPALHRALAQVRQGSTAMPTHQLHEQLSKELGQDWRELFQDFDEVPTAAASIGQVHRATTRDGRAVVVKVQFPGVAQSITSDLKNLGMLVKWSSMAPKGLFLDNIIKVGQTELSVECDYKRELLNQQRIQQLVQEDEFLTRENFVVPDVVPELSTEQVLTTEFMTGGTIDKASQLSTDERNRIGRAILYLTMQELFVWRFMQTDPNWGNFLYDTNTRRIALIDFGATREYPKDFVDGYLRIVWAAANRDEETLMAQSHRMGFLTGQENNEMIRAHLLSGFTVGEPFQHSDSFDFKASRISSRMGEHTSVFLRHRLTAPPTEVYTLHRKLAGAYMLCIQLGAVVSSRDLLENIVRNHVFEDGMPHPTET